MFQASLSTVVRTVLLVVSPSNVEAVAANDVALQHCGQEVVYVTTSVRRVLIQITFDVMSVRKPLLSTSSLSRRGATIIYNHDYDRIIFSDRDSEFDLLRLSFLLPCHTCECDFCL